MINSLFPSAAAGFDDPIGVLTACHERILRHCATLSRLAQHLAEHGLDDDARTAAAQIHRYFSTAGQHHHEDEEADLFPLLTASPALAMIITRLHSDHQQMERAWQALSPLLQHPENILSDVAGFQAQAAAFGELYEAHIGKENGTLLPQARKLLSEAQVKTLGEKMARRRGVTIEQDRSGE